VRVGAYVRRSSLGEAALDSSCAQAPQALTSRSGSTVQFGLRASGTAVGLCVTRRLSVSEGNCGRLSSVHLEVSLRSAPDGGAAAGPCTDEKDSRSNYEKSNFPVLHLVTTVVEGAIIVASLKELVLETGMKAASIQAPTRRLAPIASARINCFEESCPPLSRAPSYGMKSTVKIPLLEDRRGPLPENTQSVPESGQGTREARLSAPKPRGGVLFPSRAGRFCR